MSEPDSPHELNLEWGCITNLTYKISEIEESIDGGWPELIDMVAGAFSSEEQNKNPVEIFFNLYQFLFRLYYRLKTNPVKQRFNQYSANGDEYWITNYNYEAFKWAKGLGAENEIDNLVIKIPQNKLTDKQRAAIEKRCRKGDQL